MLSLACTMLPHMRRTLTACHEVWTAARAVMVVCNCAMTA
jgi:hypothetical protein